MFSQSSFRKRSWLRSFSLVTALAMVVCQSAANPKDDAQHQLLVGLKEGSLTTAFAQGIGKVVGTDKGSHLLVLQLDGSWQADQAIKALLKRPGVQVALPITAKGVDNGSYASVRNHATYLNALDDVDGDNNKKNKRKAATEDRGDFYDALAYYLERHVAVGTDHVDFQAIRTAADHKARMPKVDIGTRQEDPTAPGTAQTSGWTFMGPKNLTIPYNIYYGTPPLSGRISAIAYDPTTSATIYAGSGGGGLWKSTNSGNSWTCISDTTPWIYPAVSSIAIDSTNHNVIYVGTGDFDGFYPGYNQGVMKSTDGGTTWTNLASNVAGISNLAISKIVIDPSNDQIITLTTGRGNYGGPNAGTGNVWRSTNGGTSWTSANLQAADYSALDISPIDGTYFALGSGTPGLIYKSSNKGQTWQAATSPDANPQTTWDIACSKVTAGLIYVSAPGSMAVYKSTDHGSTWTNITNGLPTTNNQYNWSQSTYDHYLATVAEPSATAHELLFCGLITSCYSVNGGTTWFDYGNSFESRGGNTTAVIHSDQHQFAFAPTDPSQILIGCDGGLFHLGITGWSSGSPTISFSSLNANLGITQFYKIAPHPTDSTQALGGAQDNASPSAIAGQGGYTSWANLEAGDGGWCDWDIPQSALMTTSDKGSVFLYDITGSTENSVTQVSAENTAFVAPTAFSADGSQLYLGGQTLQSYSVASGTFAFSAGTANLTGGTLSYIDIVPTDANTIYTGGSDGMVWMTKNAGTTWKEIDGAPLPSAFVGAVAANPLGDNDVLVGYQNTGITHLWQCKNTVATTPAWTAVSGSGSTGLPDVPISAIYRSAYNPGYNWFVATDIGVFVTTNGGQTWANANENLPEVQVTDLKYAAGYLYAGTYGRGMWRIPLYDTLSAFTLTSSTTVGGAMDYGTVTVSGLAKGAGDVVSLKSSSVDVLIPASVTVPAGKASITFEVGSVGVAANTGTTITATTGAISKTLTLTLTPAALTSIKLLHTSVVGGTNSAVTVYLTGKAPAGGFKVNLRSNDEHATVIATLTIPANATYGSAAITTKAVQVSTAVQITAKAGAITETAILTLTN